MEIKTVGFIGLGVIGGSIARGIKRSLPDTTIMAYMRTRSGLEQAKAENIVDIILEEADKQLAACDMIFLCTPVEYNAGYLSKIKPFLKPGAILTDVGSTKTNIHEEVAALGLEDYFIGGHPMAGSEKTGFEHSTDHLLENAYYIITPTVKSTKASIEQMVGLAKLIGAIPIVLDYREHDRVVAAISHLPHIIASSLVNFVKDQDNQQELMKRLAAGGFKDITRIASSSPEMWEQICMTNTANIASVLKQYMESLQQIYKQLTKHQAESIYELFDSSRTYRNSISESPKGLVSSDFSFTVDVVDEPGSISILAVILSSRGISIRNVGINHNRERGEGVLKVSFYDEDSRNAAWEQLESYHYKLIECK